MFKFHGIRTPACRRYSTARSSSSVFGDPQFAQFLTAAGSPASLPYLDRLPEVVVTGRANVGKSTLLNAVLGRAKLLNTSKKAGRTRTLNFYRVGRPPGNLLVVDAPGYGSRGRPEWGQLFDYYVDNRSELKRVYILFNAKHGLNETDRMMLQSLDEKCQASGGTKFTLQAIITKADELSGVKGVDNVRRIQKEILETAPTCLPAILTASARQPFFGVEEVRRSIIEACGLGRTTL